MDTKDKPKASVVARRRTADNKSILLWSDGDITFGHVGSLVSRAVPLTAAFLALDEVCLYDATEVKALVRTARRAIKQKTQSPLGYLRSKMKQQWHVSVTEAQRDALQLLWRNEHNRRYTGCKELDRDVLQHIVKRGWAILFGSETRGNLRLTSGGRSVCATTRSDR